MKLSLKSIFSRVRKPSHPAVSIPSPEGEAARRKELGRRGEDAAVRALHKRGYRILERNYLCRTGEIDIIAEHRGTIVFVEVKTRSPRSWHPPESAITEDKMARVRSAAEFYLAAFKKPSPSRYDVVTVLTDNNGEITKVEITSNILDHITQPVEV